MERAYRKANVGGRQERSRAVHRGAGGRKRGADPRERRRLVQLLVCVVLFFAVFFGKGIFPEQLAQVRTKLAAVMGMDTDFRSAFAELGRGIAAGEPVKEVLGGLWVEVFGAGRPETYQRLVSGSAVCREERAFSAQPLTAQALLTHRFGIQEEVKTLPAQPTPVQETEPATVSPAASSEPRGLGDTMDMEMPENATMEKYELGILTMSPIQGAEGWWVSSVYGWRDHPVDGQERFHNGVDLAVNTGTDVKAFADGTVDYIGESSIYGLYTQLRHDNGVTSFYAHCSRLCVQQGQRVQRGDKIAESGETGNVTGPHLHFELRKDGILINPLYYLEDS